MALKKTVTTSHGFEAVDAYHRAEQPTIGATKSSMTFLLRSYRNKDAQCFDEKPVGCSYDLNGLNPLAQAYAHLKTLPEFAGAQDC